MFLFICFWLWDVMLQWLLTWQLWDREVFGFENKRSSALRPRSSIKCQNNHLSCIVLTQPWIMLALDKLSTLVLARRGKVRTACVIIIRNSNSIVMICYLGNSCDQSWYDILHGNRSGILFVSWYRPVRIHRYHWHILLKQFKKRCLANKKSWTVSCSSTFFQKSVFCQI
jgi:hypothetical protein